MGMIAETYLSYYLKKCSRATVEEIVDTIKASQLPTKTSFNLSHAMQALLYDKKFIRQSIRMVVVRTIGKVTVEEGFSPSLVKKAIKLIQS